MGVQVWVGFLGFGFGLWCGGSGFRGLDLGFRVWGLGFGPGVWGLGFRALGLGLGLSLWWLFRGSQGFFCTPCLNPA